MGVDVILYPFCMQMTLFLSVSYLIKQLKWELTEKPGVDSAVEKSVQD